MVTPRYSLRANPRIRALDEVLKLSKRDLDRMTNEVDKLFRRNEKRLFATQGSSGGARWRKLSKAYAKQKRKTHPGRKIMTRTGRLRRGLTLKGDSDHIARHRLGRIQIGVRSALPAYHGSVRGRKNPRLPKRDVLQSTPRQKREYLRSVSDYLVGVKLKRAARALRAGRAALRSGGA